jgi:hypothetical protein
VSAESVALSRRVAKLMGAPAIRALSDAERSRFVRAVTEAESFEALPEWVRRVIVAAEREAVAR